MTSPKRPSAKRSSDRGPVENGAPSQAWLRLLAPLWLALVTMAAYLPVLENQFVNWDDDVMLLDNPHYRGLGLAQLSWMVSIFHNGHYQPLSWITLGLDYLLWGVDPLGYHLTNVVLHVVNGIIFYFLCRMLLANFFTLPKQKIGWEVDLSAAFAALFFALHPLRVESVAWATERRDVLSGFFFLGAIYCYLRAHSQAAAGTKYRDRWLGLVWLGQFLSLSAKATAMTLPLVLIILDIFPLKRLSGGAGAWLAPPARRVLWEKWPFFLLSVLFGAVALAAQHSIGALRPVQQYFLTYRLAQGFYGIGFYVWKTFWPFQLSPLYELPYDFDPWLPLFIACAAAVLSVGLLLIVMRRRWPGLAACAAYYVVLLAPVLGVAQSGPQLVADRYSYLSCLSWALLLGGMTYHWLQSAPPGAGRRRVGAAVTAVFISAAGLGSLTWAQVGVWHDSETLWKHVLRLRPDTALAAYNLGKVYEGAGRFHDSIELYRRAIAINPTYADAHHNLARLLALEGKLDEAIGHYRAALKFKPNDAETHNNLGQLLAMNGEVETALSEFRRALTLDPRFAKSYFNLARLFVRLGQLESAVDNFQHALELSPDVAEIHAGLGDAYVRAGNIDKALIHFARAVKLKPELTKVQIVYADLLAARGRKVEAESHYREALGRSETENPIGPSR